MIRPAVRPAFAALVAWAALSVCSAAPAGAAVPDSETLLEHFQKVVFHVEAKKPAAKPLVRWDRPIRARIADDRGRKYRGAVEKLLKQLSRLTGLPIALAAEPPYNLDIFFLPEQEIQQRFKNPKIRCGGTLSGSRSRATITGAQVFISLSSDFRTHHCIIEEITQILGLPNDTGIVTDSIFNDASKATSLSITDQILVRTLYDRAMRAGMTEAEAKPVARRVIENLLHDIDAALANPTRVR